jgi:hypothetical protein
MSTGLSIVQATYGAGSTTVDVTPTVAALVKDGVLKFTVSPTTLNVTDPAPGQIKQLAISYRINGGSNNSATVKDNDVVDINAPPVRLASGLQITKAEYGYGGNYTDVTNAVQDLMSSNGSINITVGFKQVGIPDPNPNKQKHLKVEYTINGASSSQTINDGSNFSVSAPAAEAVDNSTPSQHVGSLVGIIFSSVARFFAMYLYTLSIFAGIEYGKQFISSMLWGAVCFFLPGFAFWGLPIITFWVRLFSSSDFIY